MARARRRVRADDGRGSKLDIAMLRGLDPSQVRYPASAAPATHGPSSGRRRVWVN